jgi:hypothetical protein
LHGYPLGYKFTKGKNVYAPSANLMYESPMPQLLITSEQWQQLLTLLRSKCPDDASAHASAATTENQEHLLGEMAGNTRHSLCF